MTEATSGVPATTFLSVCVSHSPLMDTVDGGASGKNFLTGIAETKSLVEDFAPDLVLYFGPDHSRALPHVVPAVTIATAARGYGDWGTPSDPYNVEATLARGLAEHLLAHDVDVAVAGDLRLDHGFGQTFVQLFDHLGAVPVLPVVVNCAIAPRASVSRIITIAEHVGRYLSATGKRVLTLGSGGLSHQPPSMDASARALPEAEREQAARRSIADAAQYVRPEWDRAFLEALTRSDWDRLRTIGDDELDRVGYGTHEIRTWVAAWAAASTQQGTSTYAPVPEWITGMGIAIGEPRTFRIG